MPHLLDPNFARSVVLMVHHDESGAFGVVLNRPTELSAPNLCATLDIEWCGDPENAVDWGGPVQPQTGWVLFEDDDGRVLSEQVQEIGSGVCFAGSIDVLREVASDPPERLRLLLGYAGWGPGQLDGELDEGSWIVEPALPDDVFTADPDELWSDVLRRKGGPFGVLALMPPDPSLN